MSQTSDVCGCVAASRHRQSPIFLKLAAHYPPSITDVTIVLCTDTVTRTYPASRGAFCRRRPTDFRTGAVGTHAPRCSGVLRAPCSVRRAPCGDKPGRVACSVGGAQSCRPAHCAPCMTARSTMYHATGCNGCSVHSGGLSESANDAILESFAETQLPQMQGLLSRLRKLSDVGSLQEIVWAISRFLLYLTALTRPWYHHFPHADAAPACALTRPRRWPDG